MRKLTLVALLMIPIVIIVGLVMPRPKTMASSDITLIAEAPANYSYVATGTTKTLYHGKMISSKTRIFHQKPNKCRIEYRTPPLNGVVIVSDGKQIRRFDPKIGREVVMESAGCTDLGSRLDLLMKNYRLSASESRQTAGRPTLLVSVRDRFGHLSKRLRVDKKTFVVLQSQEFRRGKLVSESKFDTINYTNNTSKLFRTPDQAMCAQGAGKAMPIGELSKAVGFAVTQPKYIPAGYKLDGYSLYNCPCQCGHKSAYIRYTNGLKSISIFETEEDSGCKTEGACGSHGSQGETAVVSKDGKSFIVIADLSAKELSKIANSLR